MKRIIKVFLILLICLSIKNVYAANYQMKELIPINVKTSIHTNNFSYKGLSFSKDGISFEGIKNLTDEKKPISISIGLFNKSRKNIGVINYCDLEIESKEEKSIDINFKDKYMADKYSKKDITYIAVLGDNITCRTGGESDYVGQKIDKLGKSGNGEIDSQTQLLLSILTILAGAFIVLIIYKLIFTRSFKNIDGNVVRKSYDEINRELEELREEEKRNNPPVVEEKKSGKPIEILEQEEEAKNEDKSNTDLHNLYK